MKEIHFYKDVRSTAIEFHNFKLYTTHNETVCAIQQGLDKIHSTAISALDFAWLLDNGYTVVLHENGRSGEVYEGITILTDKELRKAHDIRRLWIGGAFYHYFYQNGIKEKTKSAINQSNCEKV